VGVIGEEWKDGAGEEGGECVCSEFDATRVMSEARSE